MMPLEHSIADDVARLQGLHPAVVVVDTVSLSDRGFELVSAISEREFDPPTTLIAIVEADKAHIDRALRLGADDFSSQCDADTSLLSRVERYVRRAAVAANLTRPGSRPPSEHPLAPESERGGDALRTHRAERRLRRFQPYSDFFKHSADGMVVMQPSGRVLFANRKARAIFPLDGPVRRTNVLDFIDPSERPRAQAIARGFQAGRYPKNVDFLVRTRERQATLNVNFSATLRTESAVLFTFRDVTKERETERELTDAREFLERVIDSSVDAIVAADLKGNVRLFNRAAGNIFGYEPSEVVGLLKVERLYPPNGARDVMKKIRDAEHGGVGRLEGFAVEMQDALGRKVPVRISAALIYKNGEPSGSVGIFRDVREELRMTARLQEAEAALRRQEKGAAVAQLAGATAHELNQPLTVVIAYSELLGMKLEPDSPLRDAARVIGEQAQRMARIVRQVGQITRYETKNYVGSTQILDLEKASSTEPK